MSTRSGVLREHIPASLGDLGDPSLGPIEQEGLRHVGDRPGDAVGVAGGSAAGKRHLPIVLGDAQDLCHSIADVG